MVVAKITAWGITNAQVAIEPATEALSHTGKGDRLIQSQARPS